jgi:DNA-binding GntR family transcriptional regulator
LIRDRIADALRDAIIAGRLKPGERIRERELVDLLGVSRSPLREAIRIMESEGLVTSLPHRGASISALSAADLRELVEVRIMLESHAVRMALARLNASTLEAMERQVRDARAAGPNVDEATNFTLALTFHDLLVQACGNGKMVKLHEGFKRHQRRYQLFAFSRLGRDARALEEHRDIVEGLARRDAEAVETDLKAHLWRFYEEIAPLLPASGADEE